MEFDSRFLKLIVAVIGLISFVTLLCEYLVDIYSPEWYSVSRDALWFPIITSFLLACGPIALDVYRRLRPEGLSDRIEASLLTLMLFIFSISIQTYILITQMDYEVFDGFLSSNLRISIYWSVMSLAFLLQTSGKNTRRLGLSAIVIGIAAIFFEISIFNLFFDLSVWYWIVLVSIPLYSLGVFLFGMVLLMLKIGRYEW